MKWITINLLSIICVIVSGLMLWNDKTGWGWFLFVGLLCATVGGNNNDD